MWYVVMFGTYNGCRSEVKVMTSGYRTRGEAEQHMSYMLPPRNDSATMVWHGYAVVLIET